MSTRRSFLALSAAAVGASIQTPSAAAQEKGKAKLALEDFQPKSMLVTAQHPVQRAKYPVIDVHTHVSGVFGRRRAPEAGGPKPEALKLVEQIVHWMDELKLQTLINLTGGYGEDLERNIQTLGKYSPHFLNCVVPAWDKIEQPDYPRWQAAELERGKKSGAVGLKITKTLGLYLREHGKEGSLVKIDDPRFDPMWDAAGRLKLPVFMHISDPDAFFTPIDRSNERWEELANHPDWSFYGKDYPPKQALLEARNRVIARHPSTTFVGLHVANHPENLDEVSGWLKKYPNLHCEIAARIGELGRQPRRARRFFEEFPERIMFGTDATPNGTNVPQQDLRPAMFQCYFRFLETEDEYFDYAPSTVPPQGRWKIYGVGLPDEILKNVYHNNAARLLGLKVI